MNYTRICASVAGLSCEASRNHQGKMGQQGSFNLRTGRVVCVGLFVWIGCLTQLCVGSNRISTPSVTNTPTHGNPLESEQNNLQVPIKDSRGNEEEDESAVKNQVAEDEARRTSSIGVVGGQTSQAHAPSTLSLLRSGGGHFALSAALVLLSRYAKRRSQDEWNEWREEKPAIAFATVADALLVASALAAIRGAMNVGKVVTQRRKVEQRNHKDQIRQVEKQVNGDHLGGELSVTRTADDISSTVEEEFPGRTSSDPRAATREGRGRTAMAATALVGAGSLAGGAALLMNFRRWFRSYQQIEHQSRMLVAAGLLFGGALLCAFKLSKQIKAKIAVGKKKKNSKA
uniref:Transmembrane protein n=1 Tax=Neospora caninum (strain Liverpool) TaxID=572307 RepID=A0A0F7ULL7_NEOCL|nr:TPA: hypothetical protein BN1204_065295 [Neospora caninum Liverpool]